MHVSLLSMCRCADVKQLSFRVGVGGWGVITPLSSGEENFKDDQLCPIRADLVFAMKGLGDP